MEITNMPLFTTQSASGKRDIQVRSLLALIFALGATAGFFCQLIPQDGYMALVTMAVSFYFAKRGEQDDNKKPPEPPTPNPVQ